MCRHVSPIAPVRRFTNSYGSAARSIAKYFLQHALLSVFALQIIAGISANWHRIARCSDAGRFLHVAIFVLSALNILTRISTMWLDVADEIVAGRFQITTVSRGTGIIGARISAAYWNSFAGRTVAW